MLSLKSQPCLSYFCLHSLQMCSIAVPGMKARKRGAIVNVGSGSATFLPILPAVRRLWRHKGGQSALCTVVELYADATTGWASQS